MVSVCIKDSGSNGSNAALLRSCSRSTGQHTSKAALKLKQLKTVRTEMFGPKLPREFLQAAGLQMQGDLGANVTELVWYSGPWTLCFGAHSPITPTGSELPCFGPSLEAPQWAQVETRSLPQQRTCREQVRAGSAAMLQEIRKRIWTMEVLLS